MKVRLDNVRLSFCDLFVPTDFNGDGNMAYKAKVMIEPGEQLDKIKATIAAVLKEVYPKDSAKVAKKIEGDVRAYPLHQMDDSDIWTLSTRRPHPRKTRPTILGQQREQLTAEDGKPYPGCYVNILVDIWAGNYSGDRVGATLEGVQFVRDGQAFSSAVQASASDFEDVAVAATTGVDDLL
jgi:hypothetical protein